MAGEPKLPLDLRVGTDPDASADSILLLQGDAVVVSIDVKALNGQCGGLLRQERHAIGEVVRATICKLADVRSRARVMSEQLKK